MKTSDPCPFRVLFILRIFSPSGVSHIVCTSDGGLILYRGRLPPLPALFLSENNLQGHVLQLSQTVYLISGEEVA